VLTVAACGGHAADPEPTRTPDATPDARLVVVGDSLAFGRFADTQAEAFPRLVAADTHTALELLAAPGVTTAQIGAQTVPGGGKDVIVEAGTNDFLLQTPRARFAADYRALLAKLTAASPGAKLVCLTLWMPKEIADAQPHTIAPSSYDRTIRRECSKGTVVDLAPIYAQASMRGPAGRSTAFGPGDDFHPNTAGHAAIARAIEARLG
jgi:lysophospholipase L1-like esterase